MSRVSDELSSSTPSIIGSLPRKVDYLGFLGTALRDLQGFAALTNELIQNADDAEGASFMAFDVRPDALIVDNDGVFSDCGHVDDAGDCAWYDERRQLPPCDFHAFQLVASGAKRNREGTTGAFGIGFTAVYQITDEPQLITAGRHWILREAYSEDDRIGICGGCGQCRQGSLPGTRFVLPWALDGESVLRQRLRAEPVSADAPSMLLDLLESSLLTAILFLKQLTRIDVLTDGRARRSYERLEEDDDLLVTDGAMTHRWHRLRGDFRAEAATLRQRFPQVETKRAAHVTIAIPADTIKSGLLCATLPTQYDTGLPFHINADFYPSSDRKAIVFESDYQAHWNRAAIRGAARALRDGIGRLPSMLDRRGTWATLQAIYEVSQKAGSDRAESSLGEFWASIRTVLPSSRIVPTTDGEWHVPRDVVLLQNEEEHEAIPVLEKLGLRIAHPDIRANVFPMPRGELGGPGQLTIERLAQVLRGVGLAARTPYSEAPPGLRSLEERRLFWRELGRLTAGRGSTDQARQALAELAACAIAPAIDGALHPCNTVFRADTETVAIFRAIDPTVPFFDHVAEETRFIEQLCPAFGPREALHVLSAIGQDRMEQLWQSRCLDPVALLRWFASHGPGLVTSFPLREQLTRLPVFPTVGGLRPLTQLVLPGGFKDPLGLAELVDVTLLGGRTEFLRDLGAEELSFHRYVLHHVAPALVGSSAIPREKKRQVAGLLAAHLGELRDLSDVRAALSNVPIVECEDGEFRLARHTYLPGEVVRIILGDQVHFARLPDEHTEAVRECYQWLGVVDAPRANDILSRIQELISVVPTVESVSAIQKILEHLGERWRLEANREREGAALVKLQSMAWLPARGRRDRWYSSREVYANFSSHLFDTQASFLDLPRSIESRCTAFFDFLGLTSQPTVSQVVDHLRTCARSQLPVNKEVYTFLNLNSGHAALRPLDGEACINLDGGHYVRADQVLWGEHPFGAYRFRLNPELRRYADFFSRLGVREAPNYRDAVSVLLEVAAIFSPAHRSLDDESRNVVLACWRILSQAVDDNAIHDGALRELVDREVVPNVDAVLYPPSSIFFEDRAGLASKFGGYLTRNVIPRPSGAWSAMARAGVRALSSAVTSDLIECVDPVRDDVLHRRLDARRSQLARVLDAQGLRTQAEGVILDRIAFSTVRELKIQYRLSVFGRVQTSDPEGVTAHFLRDEGTLYFVFRHESRPWLSIARELALAITSGEDAGALPAAIKDVLSAASDEEAKALLDELGLAPVDEETSDGSMAGGYIDDIGDQADYDSSEDLSLPISTGEDSRPGRMVRPPSTDGHLASSEGAEEGAVPEDTAVTASEDQRRGARSGADGAMSDTAGEKQALSPKGSLEEGRSANVSKRAYGDRSRPGKREAQGRLRTYVTSNPSDRDTDPDDERQDQLSALDRAGIERVLEHERGAGRHPESLAHNHPGYDILSRDSSGKPARFIEVKSVSGEWGSLGVAISRRQYEEAEVHGDRFWLYVVERALDEDFVIFRISDPGRQVTQFIYDDGWRAMAEPDAVPTTGSTVPDADAAQASSNQ